MSFRIIAVPAIRQLPLTEYLSVRLPPYVVQLFVKNDGMFVRRSRALWRALAICVSCYGEQRLVLGVRSLHLRVARVSRQLCLLMRRRPRFVLTTSDWCGVECEQLLC